MDLVSLRDELHDRIDAREHLAEQAREIVRKTVKEGLARALDATDTVESALTLLAAQAAHGLDALTTDAVKTGAKLIMARSKKAKARN